MSSPCPCCAGSLQSKSNDDFVNFTANPGHGYDELITLKYNALTHMMPHSARYTFTKKHEYEVPLEGWTILNQEHNIPSDLKDLGTNTTLLAERDGVFMYMDVTDLGPDRAAFVEFNLAAEQVDNFLPMVKELVGDGQYEEEQSENEREVKIGFWSMTSMGPHLTKRRMLTQPWDEVSQNYSSSVNKGLTRLMELDPDNIAGKMILLHGVPGTGKTSSLRTLALSWKKWCDLEVVIDPERLFSDSDYLLTVLQERRDADRWTMLLLEDCDELIRKEAKTISGQALSRLLNATDGFLGQGLNLLIGITSNEPLEKLHPAVLRSGRCLAKLEVPELSREEAQTWLKDEPELQKQIKGPMTLADLYALRSDRAVISDTPEIKEAPGVYI